ncbi:MAG: hypothetical protein MUF00_09720 [Gemmatimonadaceae bacterium]|nr:hypothetical protein [Gemmatimonadaceae bacterium]
MRHPIASLLALCCAAVSHPAIAQRAAAPVPAILLTAHAAGLADTRVADDLEASGFGRAATLMPYLGVDLAGAAGRSRYGLEFGVLWQPDRTDGRDGRSQQTGAYTFTATYGLSVATVARGTLIPTIGIGGTHRYTQLRGGTGTADRSSWSAYRNNPGRESTLHTSTGSVDLGMRWQWTARAGAVGFVRELRAGYRLPAWGDRPSVDGTDLAGGPRARSAVWYAGLGFGIGRAP